MRRYRLILIVMLFGFVFNLFAINFDSAVDNFKTLVHEYDAGESRYQHEFDYMSIYRKYTLTIVGGVKNDSHYYDLNILLEDLFEESKSGNPTDDISLAAFLAYVSADLFDNNFDITILNSFPPYYKSFNNYVQEIKDYTSDYFAQWIGYAIGLVSAKPDDLFDIEKSSSRLRLRLKLDYEENLALKAIIEENINAEIEERLTTAIKNVQNDIRRNDDERSVERSIKKNSIFVFSEVIDEINREKEMISNAFIDNSTRTYNIWLLRFLLYAALILLFMKQKKRLPFIFAGIVIADALYLFITGSLILSDVESLIYGTLSIMTFCFALIIFISKILKKSHSKNTFIISSLLIIFVAILYFVPAFTSPDTLKIDNIEGFYGSPSYEALKDDIFIWNQSYFGEIFTEFDNSNVSVEEADNMLTKRYHHAVKFSGSFMKEEIDNFIVEKTAVEKYSKFEKLKSALNATVEFSAPSIMLYNTLTGSVIIMFITLIVSFMLLSDGSGLSYKLNLTLITFLYVWFILRGVFMKQFTFVVEKGFPLIYNQQATPDLLFVLSGLTILIICFFVDRKKTEHISVS